MFFVYVDITNDGRPYYVGKGDEDRLKVIERNVYHTRIAKKHGQVRRIVFETLYEQWAFDREVELIALLKTHNGLPGHWGANLTDGGEGSSGRIPSEETRRRISVGKTGATMSTETCETRRINALRQGQNQEIQKKKSRSLRGKPKTEEHKRKIRERWALPEIRQRVSETMKAIRKVKFWSSK